MNLSGLLTAVREASGYRGMLNSLLQVPAPLGREPSSPSPRGLRWALLDAARPAVLAALHQDWQGPVLVLTAQPERAHYLREQVGLWSPDTTAAWYFPAPDALFYDFTPWDGETVRGRVTLLSALAIGDPNTRSGIIFSSVWALMTRTLPPQIVLPGIKNLRVGQGVRLKAWLDQLVAYAYQPVSVVEEPGTFSQRGGILDIYPTNATQPVRIELLGEQIESMRAFDPASQRSLQQVESIALYPASEALPVHGQAVEQCLPEMTSGSDAFSAMRLQRDRGRLSRGEYFRGMEFYVPCLYPMPATLLDYLPANVLIVVDDPAGVEAAAETLETQAADLRAELMQEGKLPAQFPVPYSDWSELKQALSSRSSLSLGYQDSATPEAQGLVESTGAEQDTGFHNPPGYGGRIEQMLQACRRFQSEGKTVIIASRQAPRLSNLFEEAGEPVALVDDLTEPPPKASLMLVEGSLAEGWMLAESPSTREPVGPSTFGVPAPTAFGEEGALGGPSLVLLTDAEVFGWARQKRRSFTRKKAASPESFFADLHGGDLVVHIEHGIGIYLGLAHKEVDGTQREYLDLEYAAGDRLYVPVSQMDRITRYVGSSDHSPAVHRLGSADWASVRARAKKAVQDIARELLELYATREVVDGHAFPQDNVWQQELEASFQYEETDDQARAVSEVKADMESPRPMDRLICGDVGYGKTEVAVRAAFKAVMGGKQVAVLVPTTVLAQQHLLTFKQRLAAFPVEAGMLSRFCSPHEQRETLERLKEGKVDILIGTHRLLQKDVAFKELGLLIVDEEQRFGVRHKEWLKRMRRQIDVLTMTATPIPRTLYMSMSGVRDMSTIDTPPEARLPIRTQVAEFDEGLVRRAILRELNRDGQVYFVHNRVQGIRQIAQRLQKIVPEASVVIGHGQMPEDKLSSVMLDFATGKYDVLVCTSIIESGLDIPNVNTIIINRADCFGLAQLYQLRGRVGRSAVQAYSHLLYPKHLKLSEVARRRLEAILESSELGAGFRIAMRDLEIRGAGEILGARQHGHIVAIGFELYTRLLAQAVQQLKAGDGAEAKTKPEIELTPLIELPLQAYLPEDYVPDEELRIKLYQRLAAVQDEDELDDLRRELEDRFGLLPEPAEHLLYVLRVRLLASRAGVETVGREENVLVLKLAPRAQSTAAEVVRPFGQRAWVGRGQLWLDLTKDQGNWRTLLVALLLSLDKSIGTRKERGKAVQ